MKQHRLTDYKGIAEIMSTANYAFSILFMGGRYETFAPKRTEATGWIRIDKGHSLRGM